ncbi:50S ribosomal protein L6 [Candidatus Erwinia haradaeae]|uniref:50S ribosomal protein L6 n=1 Tax=Candidatus Erwinia haradaeae TaxID=1922217 RepID=A0A451D285_9GAMM|nr:50S ribosomal protein L6 [Candidatus Erwinia haradaeae]VFP79726.1 50S ribosomal protein L6 [Candidatus Erwinia haradaeae]
MSRVAKAPVNIPINVQVTIDGQIISVVSKNEKLSRTLNRAVVVQQVENSLIFFPRKGFCDGWAQAGTSRALVYSMMIGVTEGFIKKIQLVGVGYRAILTANKLSLSLGLSHPINYVLPNGITATCISQTDITLKSADKQLLGQVAADLRAYRRPEPYKGKGIRYVNEIVRRKEAKKK